ELGGIVAGAGKWELGVLRSYGSKVGLAFQITDDLLDVDGNQAVVGKRVAKDAERGKLTFPQLLGIDESRRRVAGLVEDACAIISKIGPFAEPLRALARLVADRRN
ncbi:MAG: polyprenyl synthetase family protein, partial [Planctomycetes bacterium]|nr:polyprenyl synthetase family protein [Planctomycetota bacterium]